MEPRELEHQLADHDMRVALHGFEAAEQALRDRLPDKADEIIQEFRRRIGEPLRLSRGLLAAGHTPWYLPKPDSDSPRWAYAKSQLGLSPEALERTSKVADEILARISNPRGPEVTTRGLVLGHVQSGKTTSFLSVAAKAADNGFDLIIVLAGVHNSLRRQTQNRAVRTLVHQPHLWWLGTAVGDFRPDGNPLAAHLAGAGKRGLLVVKKHQVVLRRLADWLESTRDTELRNTAILVIDDEADQAGLNVAGDRLEGVHKQLHRIVNLKTAEGERRCAYLAYTATPYANILTSQDEWGLYPRDFIYPLQTPDGYVGAQELFGDNQVGRPVAIERDESEVVLTAGLCDAIKWFVVATAARAGLGGSVDSFHSSMLIHTTQSIDEQRAYRPVIEKYLKDLRAEFDVDESDLEHHYRKTLALVPARQGGGEGFVDERAASWEEVRPHVREVLDRLVNRTPAGDPFVEDGHRQRAHSGVIVDNSGVDWEDRLTYSDLAAGQPSVTIIAIGGNTLSRGLTLEGLVCSYFARTARTYDSLMQMARWFGYRPGYRHLLRIWTTQALYNWFVELEQVEQELRDELLWMERAGLRPDQYGPRIRVSPNMNITRAAAMHSVARSVTYSDRRIDLAWLDLDSAALEHNQEVTRLLASRMPDRDSSVSPSRLYRSVPLDVVAEFLFTYRYHSEEKRLDVPSLRHYVEKEASNLARWSVLFKFNPIGPSEFDLGSNVGTVRTVSRARKIDASVAYISSVIETADFRLDVGSSEPVKPAQYRAAGEPPMLVVYCIDPVSTPRGNRVALNAPSTPISFGLALPKSESFVEYVAPRIAEIEEAISHQDRGDLNVS